MKIKINDIEFTSPLYIEGIIRDIFWLGRRLSESTAPEIAEGLGEGAIFCNITTDDDYERMKCDSQLRREEHILAEAAKIQETRNRGGFIP